ncbi:hypothetical protein TNCV_2670781 [Trichonephila clavipes]|nr:hypothetical protein TNCV_2670781 [Trichonephila clavipes]
MKAEMVLTVKIGAHDLRRGLHLRSVKNLGGGQSKQWAVPADSVFASKVRKSAAGDENSGRKGEVAASRTSPLVVPDEVGKRKLDLTGASEMNRLYPNSRRESGNENQYLNTLPRQGRMEEEAARRKRDKNALRGQDWRSARKGGLTAPKTRSRSTKTQSE